MHKLRLLILSVGILPISLIAFSTGPPVKRTGAAIDGAVSCTACHRTFAPANSDSTGSVTISTTAYTPGVKQIVHVTVKHPQAARWGFQLTARMASDETKPAGTFTGDTIVKVLCDNGAAAPCSDTQTQFAEHSNAPRTDAGLGFTFDVSWTPPSSDAGDIVFYAAGNAANGDGANSGDRIYTTVLRISGPCSLPQKPSVKAMVSSASYQAAWSAGSLVSIFGGNFAAPGKTRAVTAGDIVNQKFPQTLGCIAVTVNGQNAPVIYVQQDQINVQAPSASATGPAQVVVIANPGAPNEARSDPFTVTPQQAFAPALFTFDGKSAAATTANGSAIVADPAVIPTGAPAKPGDVVVLYGTGLGSTNPAYQAGDIATAAAPVTASVTVTVGGITVPAADVLYAGVSPQSICGLQQINVRLPQSLPDGNAPILLSVGGNSSASGTTIAVKR